MTKEEDVLAALDKPRAIHSLQLRVDPSSKSTDTLQDLLMAKASIVGAAHAGRGKVKFDIITGKWSKA